MRLRIGLVEGAGLNLSLIVLQLIGIAGKVDGQKSSTLAAILTDL